MSEHWRYELYVDVCGDEMTKIWITGLVRVPTRSALSVPFSINIKKNYRVRQTERRIGSSSQGCGEKKRRT